jgi:hypothetical protein
MILRSRTRVKIVTFKLYICTVFVKATICMYLNKSVSDVRSEQEVKFLLPRCITKH